MFVDGVDGKDLDGTRAMGANVLRDLGHFSLTGYAVTREEH